jgi:hypothetical protein
MLSWLGIVRNLRPVPDSAYREEEQIGGRVSA